MSDSIPWRELIHETRPRVYLLWAVLTGVGYTATHFYQNPNINGVWFVIGLIGFGYMYKVMPLRIKQLQQIYLAWLIPISLGLIVSALAVHTSLLSPMVTYLGSFWLLVSALGYLLNGMVDPPSEWYYAAAAVNIIAAVMCWRIGALNSVQYLVAAAVSVWSLLNLWIFRGAA